jgi:sulfur carrier protein ThiS
MEPEDTFTPDPEELDDDGIFDDDADYEPEPPALVTDREEEVDQTTHAVVIHDSFGEKYANVAAMRERGGSVTVLRVLGAMNLEPKGTVQYYLNGNVVSNDHVINAGDSLYIVGKLAGGK